MFPFRRRIVQSRSNLFTLQGLILPRLRFFNNIFSKRYIKPPEAEYYEPLRNIFPESENHEPVRSIFPGPENREPARSIIPEFEKSFEEYFSLHISGYLGQTVTVFVKGGGYSGLGYTGILFNVNPSYIQLVIKPGPAPACSLGSACLSGIGCNATGCNSGGFYSPDSTPVLTPGTIASIPVCKIASFVHNSV